jgi:hypothetical protein
MLAMGLMGGTPPFFDLCTNGERLVGDCTVPGLKTNFFVSPRFTIYKNNKSDTGDI